MADRIDVLIIGAGLSGIGAAHYLQQRTPGKSYVILEARTRLGGTWDLFTYPGVRSDSDLATFSYEFRPWRQDKSIAPAHMILDYLAETASDEGIDSHIRYSRRVTDLDWSEADGCWTATVEHVDSGEVSELVATWVFCAGGYYRYDRGYSPGFAGAQSFTGRIIHPQDWPADLDYAGKDVVVIGSGATAMTIVPAIAGTARHVTMVQRTPTYVLRLPSVDRYALRMRAKHGDERAHQLARRRSIRRQRIIWTVSRRYPGLMRRFIRRVNRRSLPVGFPVDVHFNPPYNPWDQRLCLAPDGDLFHALRDGTASIVTDGIRTFTPRGVRLESGQEIPADIVVTATGLNVQLFGGVRLSVDGHPVVARDHVVYRGMMLDGVPNFAFAIGYTNATWTLKIGLLCEYFTRLLDHMDANGWTVCRPELPEGGIPTRPLLDFGAGYVQRSLDDLPRQGDRAPWLTSVNYYADVKLMRKAPVQDGALRFGPAPAKDAPMEDERFCSLPSGIRICYTVDGDDSGRPLILIAGIGLDLRSWDPALVATLTKAGFRVIRLDNRDSGRSSQMSDRPPGRRLGRQIVNAYSLDDLADDVIGLLDHLHVGKADVVGMSMGGMIGQLVAARYPERVRTLVSIISTTGDPHVGQPARSTMLALMSAPATDADSFARGYRLLQRHIASGPYGPDREADERWARQAWARMSETPGFVPGAGFARQIGAIRTSGDRTPALRRITAPTLVIHGDKDRLVHPTGGAATARAIPGSAFVTIRGLRHQLPASVTPELARLIIEHTHSERAGSA